MDDKTMRMNYYDTMMRARKGYSRVMEPICSQWDLTRNELDVLVFLYNNPEFNRAADVASRRGMAKSHVSLSVNSLEAKGLLRRSEDPRDKRTVRLELTGEAEYIARQGREAQKAFFTRIYAGVTGEELAAWAAASEKISRNINELD